VLAGINRVNEYIKFNPNRIHPLTGERGSPRFFIVIGENEEWEKEASNYSWQKKKRPDSNEPDRPLKVKDHAMDDTRYYVMSRPEKPYEKKPLQMKTASVVLGQLQEKLKKVSHTGQYVPKSVRQATTKDEGWEEDPIKEALDDLNFR
jgi:hypothetical protein